jgi:alpha-glucuronidase
MPKTQLMAEVEITQENLGHSNHLVYLGTTWKEFLNSDTYAEGTGATVMKVLEGKLSPQKLTGIAGVANTGDDRNWCGHPFAQANWYAFGRLAWNPSLEAQDIAREWSRMTLTSDSAVEPKIVKIMMESREAIVDYESPLGLAHIMGGRGHYDPAPSKNDGPTEWRSTYYHRADGAGLGFDRTGTGSNGVACYYPGARQLFTDLKTCPENLLLWFHHVPWNYQMASGRTMWDELCIHYQSGVDWVTAVQKTWNGLSGKIDPDQQQLVAEKLAIQEKDAKHWRNVCLTYFQGFSKLPYPEHVEVTPEEAH